MSLALRAEIVLLAAYLFGSLNFATILVRVFEGGDIRQMGSGNAGATNVLRTSGKALGLSVLLLDALKGTLAVLAMRLVTYDPRWVSAAAVLAILGHVFPVWFGFRGGKGVATAVGAFLAIAPLSMLVLFAVFFAVVGVTRFVSLGSITTACLLPVSMRLISKSPDPEVLAGAATAVLLVFTHRANIRRLLAGTERKLGAKKEP